MISEDEIRKKARELRIPPSTIERDYAQNWLLNVLSSQINMVLKGGTGVRKMYFGDYRFSDDLDFTLLEVVRKEKLEELIKESVKRAKEESGINFDEIIGVNKSQAADIYKILGSYFLEKQREQEALEYFQKSISANPLIGGVKSKLQKLSKKLGVEVESSAEAVFDILQEKEKTANEWWAKRDLANEYVKIKQYDQAWRLFNEAILLRAKEGMPCNTIYSHMAKMLEKENRYKEALFQYLLAYRGLLKAGGNEPPRYVSQGIDRCLRKSGVKNLSHIDLYELVKKETDPGKIQASLGKFFEQK